MAAARTHFGASPPPNVLSLTLAALLTYQFKQFGLLVNTFGTMRRACDELLARLLAEEEREADLGRTLEVAKP